MTNILKLKYFNVYNNIINTSMRVLDLLKIKDVEVYDKTQVNHTGNMITDSIFLNANSDYHYTKDGNLFIDMNNLNEITVISPQNKISIDQIKNNVNIPVLMCFDKNPNQQVIKYLDMFKITFNSYVDLSSSYLSNTLKSTLEKRFNYSYYDTDIGRQELKVIALLNNNETSPFYNNIKKSQTNGIDYQEGWISNLTILHAISSHNENVRQSVLMRFYKNKDYQFIARILINYFSVIQQYFPDKWDKLQNNPTLFKNMLNDCLNIANSNHDLTFSHMKELMK